MWGAIIGDIIGSTFESENNRTPYFELFRKNARFTDDTVCTAAVADILYKNDWNKNNHEEISDQLRLWCCTYLNRGFGSMFYQWIANAINKPYNSYGNGALMRISPVAKYAVKHNLSIDKALEVNGDKSELYALQGFLYQGRIQVSAMRGMTYSQKAAEAFEKAVKENPNNPRAQYLLGQNIYYTPKLFGGGTKNALPKFQEAKALFESENGKTGIAPKWGAKANQRMIDACNKENS